MVAVDFDLNHKHYSWNKCLGDRKIQKQVPEPLLPQDTQKKTNRDVQELDKLLESTHIISE